MKSMTGYGTAQGQNRHVMLEVSVKTVNGRFLETRIHSPRECMAFDLPLRKIIAEFFQRGTVDVYINRKIKKAEGDSTVVLQKDIAKQYLQSLKQISKQFKLDLKLTAESLARFPDVFSLESANEVDETEEKTLLAIMRKACEFCLEERQREGKALQKLMLTYVRQLQKLVIEISEHRTTANQALAQRFEEKIKSKSHLFEVDPQRLAQEIALQIDRSDIDEELQRLDEHLKNYLELVQNSKGEGKKLDFYTQELLREINTIGSKSQVTAMTQLVVECKTIVERLREQVQNVE